MAQKTYKDKILELYRQSGGNQNTGGATQTGTVASAPTAQQQSNAMLDLILNRQPYSYDPKTDPAAQAIRKQTARDARAVTQDTLGRYAGMTGGMPSTAAVSAAAQAGNQATAAGADRIAELERLAYSRYQQEGQEMNSVLALLQQQAGDEYNRGRDALADQRYADELAYGREQDAYNRQMQEQQWQYQKEQDAQARADAEYQKKLALAQLAASYGDDRLLKEMGIDVSNYGSGSGGSYIGSGGGSGGGSGSGGGGGTPTGLPDADYNDLLLAYGKTLPADVWAQYAARYGEDALKARGFTRKTATPGHSGNTGGQTEKEKPGGGNNRVSMML